MTSNFRHWSVVALLLGAFQPAAGASRQQELPDKEMLRMIDFLRDMEMIKQMEMLRDLQHLESGAVQANNNAPRKAAPSTKKESLK
ncbi:MAG: hypothetical protein EXR70_15970 [Deltaproteobacteria bacterium]|nr:hypothetical protein [Deltaproteobacteria bacterium]